MHILIFKNFSIWNVQWACTDNILILLPKICYEIVHLSIGAMLGMKEIECILVRMGLYVTCKIYLQITLRIKIQF